MPTGIYQRTPEVLKKLREWGNSRRFIFGKNHHGWKGGFNLAKYRRRKRHEQGISKNYNRRGLGLPPISRKERRKIYKYNFKNAGYLSVNIIQEVYEDNIKKFGTLTCYLCLKPISFGKDHLEHKNPLSRGGTNARENLDIACQYCNLKKSNKTEGGYRHVQGMEKDVTDNNNPAINKRVSELKQKAKNRDDSK